LFLAPTQLTGLLNQSILASSGFAVVLDLRRTRLANVDERCVSQASQVSDRKPLKN